MSVLANLGKPSDPAVSERAAFIFRGDRVDLPRLQGLVERTLAGHNWAQPLFLPTSAAEPGFSQAQQAIKAGATRIVVIGGDGTLREVLQGAFESDGLASTSFGIVPVGTGNVLARNLGIALNGFGTAFRRALLGEVKKIDLGVSHFERADGQSHADRVFTVMAGVGLDAKIFANTDRLLKKRYGWVAYIDGGLKSLPTLFERINVSVGDGPERNLKVHSLLVGNCGLLPGGILLMPDAAVDDGVLDVAAVGPRRFWNWIAFWSRVTWQNAVLRRSHTGRKLLAATANVKTLENLSGQVIVVRPERAVDMQLDGDHVGTVTRVEFGVLPLALNLRL